MDGLSLVDRGLPKIGSASRDLVVDDIDAVFAACELAAPSSLARWGATKKPIGSRYVRSPEVIIVELAKQIGSGLCPARARAGAASVSLTVAPSV
jgi:hypothetical protein